MKKNTLLSIALTQIFSLVMGQEVPKKIFVEHTTNTLCSTCAARNPGFYANYTSQNTGNMIHLAIHPSSPYSACILNKHDKVANDERTKHYGIFGSTPRLVINGLPVSASTSYNSPAIFAPYVNQTSPVEMKVYQQKFASDSIRIRVVVTTVASHTLANQVMYIALAEDTVFYDAPNGEKQHYDVFRRALTPNQGMPVSISSTVGDSLVFTYTTAAHTDWNFTRIFAIAMVQDEATKVLTQAESSAPSDQSILTVGIQSNVASLKAKIFPTITTGPVEIRLTEPGLAQVKVYAVTGQVVLESVVISSGQINVSSLPSGIYFVRIETENGSLTEKVMKL